MKRSIIALSTFALLVAGCSARTSEGGDSASGDGSAGETTAKSAAHIGDTLDLTRADGSRVAVTMLQIINPATVANGAGDPTKVYVAAKLKLLDSGPSPIEGDVNVNVALAGSDNQMYTPDLNNVTDCTNFEDGQFHLAPGDSATGCVVFALPHGVTPAKIKYTPSAGFADDFGEWQVS